MGASDKALECLAHCAAEFPKAKGVFLRSAELYARLGNYKAAFECTQQEKERDTSFAEDWRYSAILALGGVLGETETRGQVAEAILKAHPELVGLVHSLLATYWPPFRRLSEPARQAFAQGTLFMHLAQLDAESRAQWATAALAKAVELELKRIFVGFRDCVRNSQDLKVLAESGQWKSEPKLLCKFLLGEPRLTLGEMARLLVDCRRPNTQLMRQLKAHATKRSLELVDGKSTLRLQEIASARGDSLHDGRVKPELVARFADLCRRALEIILQSQAS